MDPDSRAFSQDPTHIKSTATLFRWPYRRKLQLRRRKLPTARLGGKRPRRGHFLVRLLRRGRLRWLKLKYLCILRKLKNYYRSLIRDMMEASSTIESAQQRILLETSLAIPVMGISFASFPNAYVPDRA
ncbi:hypothetical protein NMG60_11004055 [Bertholletia excelsa]